MTLNVKIYKPSKTTMQSGRAHLEDWVLEYETISAREPEPLMGWSASKDTLNQVKLTFKTLEKAIDYASKNGWTCTVLPSQERKISPKNYGDKFKYFPPTKKNAT